MASTAAYDELDRVRKALKHARIKRDRVPKADAEARSRADEKVATLEKRRDELYAQHGRRTAGKLEDAQTDHASGADLVRRGLTMALTGLSRMEGANKDTVAAALEQVSGAAGSSEIPASSPRSGSSMAADGACSAAITTADTMSPEDEKMWEELFGGGAPTEQPRGQRKRKRDISEQPVELSHDSAALPGHCYDMPPELVDHYQPRFVMGALLRALKDHAMSLYAQAEPIHLQRFPKKPLSQCMKVFMADVQTDGWFPQYQFANMATKDYLRRDDIQGTPVAELVLMLRRSFSADPPVAKGQPVCAVNCYASGGGDCIPSHRDQAFTIASDPECETVGSVFIVTVLEDDTANRPLCIMRCAQNADKQLHGHADIKAIEKAGARITGSIAMEHGSLLAMPGPFNRDNYHCVLKDTQRSPARRVTYTIRFCMRLFVNPLRAEYMIWTKGKWDTRALPSPIEPAGPAASKPGASGEEAVPPLPKQPRTMLDPVFPADTAEQIVQCLVPPPTLDNVDSVLLLQGPELVELMERGVKLIDNQKMKLETPKWYAVKLGMSKEWRKLSWAREGPLAALIRELEHRPDLECWHGCVPVLLYFAECREASACSGHAWAAGPYCYVVAASVLLTRPVKIAPRGQALKWKLSAEERQQILEQAPDRVTQHDLGVLN